MELTGHMVREAFRRPPLALQRQDALIWASVLGLTVATTIIAVVPVIHGHLIAPAVDVVLDTVCLVIAASVTALAWLRFVERRETIALYQTAAFMALTVGYLAAVFASMTTDRGVGSLGAPDKLQVQIFVAARVVAAALLAAGGLLAHAGARPGRPLLVALLPGVLIVTVVIALRDGADLPLPAIVMFPPGTNALPEITPFGVLVQLLTAGLFLVAAFAGRAVWRRERAASDGWIVLGLVFAGFAELQWALYPSGHPGQISTADTLRLAFFLALLVGIDAEARSTLSRLRLANVELARLHEVDVSRASLEERARLARELHDGLAQDLWLAKLKTGQVREVAGLPRDALPVLAEAEEAIDSGLTEARQAVLALRMAASDETGFCGLMRRYIEEYEDRFGLRVEFASEGDTRRVPPRTEAEILRIAQEALTNVRKHAAATVVGVRLVVTRERVRLRVVDNGCGFNPAAADARRYGLSSMRERAALIGGRLEVRSRIGEGTRVLLSAPLPAQSAATLGGTR